MDQHPTGIRPSLLPIYSASNWTYLRRRKATARERLFRLRFLLGSIIFEKDVPSEEIVAEVFDLIFTLGRISEPTFVRKWGFLLFTLLGIRSWNSPSTVKSVLEDLAQTMRILPNHREYYSQKSELSKRLLELSYRFPKKIQPKRFIAVGYDDQGSQQDMALDGSPHWAEIASDAWYQYRQEQQLKPRYASPLEARTF